MMSAGVKHTILVLTSIYPASDVPKEWTPIVHFFTKEWVKSGNRVMVINYVSRFPIIAYCFARLFRKKISSKVGFIIGDYPLKSCSYELDGVNVYRIPMRKIKPHGRFSDKEINNAVRLTEQYCEQNIFKPDVIVSHWANPSVVIMKDLKQFFGCKTAYIAHGGGHFENLGPKAYCYLESIDKIGFRSAYIKRTFEKGGKYIKPSFMCYSGIPSKYVDSNLRKSFKDISKFIYVGTLISRKYPAEIIKALRVSYGDDFFSMTYIGQGEEANKVKNIARNLNVEKRVHLLGRRERDEVVRHLDDSDVFVMVSKNEAFGLVYLEAMARGCITIASRNEGFDGIIQDGVNGFLCEAGNVEELVTVITRIRILSPEERQSISDAAIRTACELTDEKAAAYYLDQITM